jgi:phospholipid-binding lipoprotein MlaA
MNRGIFWFNEQADKYFLEPVAVVWDFLLPGIAQRGLRNAFDNARFPVIFVNDLLQAKPVAAAEDLGRFVVNTTVGVAGLWDPARRWGLEGNNEDFGQTLQYWGVPTGPYLVLPFLGPSSPTEATGLAVDSVTPVYGFFIPFWVSATITGTNIVNRRSLLIEEIRENRASALDFYVFVRNAYVSYRRNLVNDDEETAEESSDDMYYPIDFE